MLSCCRFVSAGSRFWVAVLDGQVVGIVAAQGREEDNTVELRRMSVDSRYRGKGIAKALGRRVLEFAMLNNYSAVVLGTTAVKMAAHKLYESLGFQKVGETDNYTLPGMSRSIMERLFFQIRYSRYRLQLHEEWECVRVNESMSERVDARKRVRVWTPTTTLKSPKPNPPLQPYFF